MGRGQSPKSVTLGIHSHGGSQDPPWSAAISFSQSRSRHRLLTPTCSLQPMREPLGQTAHKLWRLSPVSSRPTGTHLKFNKVRLIDSYHEEDFTPKEPRCLPEQRQGWSYFRTEELGGVVFGWAQREAELVYNNQLQVSPASGPEALFSEGRPS